MNPILPPIGPGQGPQGFGVPPPAEAREIEELIARVGTALEQQDQTAMAEAFTAIGQKIDALMQMENRLPQVSQNVLDHLEKEYQFLVTHQDTLHPDQIVEFSLIASQLSNSFRT